MKNKLSIQLNNTVLNVLMDKFLTQMKNIDNIWASLEGHTLTHNPKSHLVKIQADKKNM